MKDNQASLLMLYQAQVKAAVDLPAAAAVVTKLHQLFELHPTYLSSDNIEFLAKYPKDYLGRIQPFRPRTWREARTLLESDGGKGEETKLPTFEDLKQDIDKLDI